MANYSGLGGFASGLSQGLQTGARYALDVEDYKEKRAERADREKKEALTTELEALVNEKPDFMDKGQALQGPPAPDSMNLSPEAQGTNTVTPMGRLQSILASAMLSTDDKFREAVGRTAAAALAPMMEAAMNAGNSGNTAKEAELLNRAASGLMPGMQPFTVNKDGVLVAHDGAALDTPQKKQGYYLYLRNSFYDPIGAYEKLLAYQSGLRGEDREDQRLDMDLERLDIAWNTLGQNAQRIGLERDRLNLDKYQFAETLDLKYAELAANQPLLDARAKYYAREAAMAEAQAAAFGQPVIWDDPTDRINALKNFRIEMQDVDSPVFNDEFAKGIGLESADQVREVVTTMAASALNVHGMDAYTSAKDGAIQTLLALRGNPNVSVVDVEIDKAGRPFVAVRDANSGSVISYPVSPEVASEAARYLEQSDANNENAAFNMFNPGAGVPPSRQQAIPRASLDTSIEQFGGAAIDTAAGIVNSTPIGAGRSAIRNLYNMYNSNELIENFRQGSRQRQALEAE